MTDASPPSTTRYLLVAAAVPVIVTAIAVAIQLVLLPRLPDPVATRWGTDGVPNSFSPVWLGPLLTALVGLGLPAFIVLSALPGIRRGESGATSRFTGALAPAMSVFLGVLTTWSLVVQVDLASADDSRFPPAAALVPFAAALAVGLGAWFLLPRQEAAAHGSPVSPRTLTASERALWTGRATLAPIALILIGAALVAVWVTVLASAQDAVWISTGVGVFVLVAAVTTTSFRVRVDGTGLSVVSALGIPRFGVPIADITSIEVISVQPVSQFGGWGIRRVPGAFGIVLRSGEAIQVTRSSGPRFVVTVTNAAAGAALLQGLVNRAGRPH